ncbi:MAG: pyridoxine 5'-phosphate synthase [Candidatus Omnitrophica bacterium CG11_big_fil_rev_8_21_14_0_20_63_9]|nr:MAG: pyridoxine 5'-phosphate synthase [Candidatus Omnitrophica bacterium CG11_big_fil_rev_8_21_14_0_20_63_9]
MRLGVNIDHIATVRQARRGHAPDPIEAARTCERAGAQSIVCHLREDRRHIQDDDVRRLRQTVQTQLNLEMSIAPSVVAAALAVKPHQVTLVPERRQELTTEGGLDVVRLSSRLQPLIKRFRAQRIDVSLFVDPVAAHVRAARDVGATTIELHTGAYANASTSAGRRRELRSIEKAARLGRQLELAVAAGHGLDYENVSAIVGIGEIEELNIGFSIISRALAVGLERAVGEMVELLGGRGPRSASPARTRL